MLNLSLHGRTVPTAITMTSVALSALFLAQGASYLAAISLLHARLPLPAARGEPEHAALGAERPDGTAILARNIFDFTVGPLWPKPPAKVDKHEPESEASAPLCDASLRMSGSIWSAFSPWQSLALLGTGVDAELYRTGTQVDGNELVQITSSAALLRRRDGHLCSVTMFADTRGAAAHESSLVPAHSVDPSDIDRGIQARSETEFSIDRTLVERIARAPMQLAGTVRIVPHEENGRLVGVKVFGVRGSPLLGKLGVKNGDLLRTINGIELSDPSGALEAYALLRSANHLSLAILRRGQPMTLEYELH